MNRQAGKNLEENEIKAVNEFLRSYVPPFYESRLRKSVLEQLVYKAEVLNIEADSARPFTHNTDLFAIVEQNGREKKSKKNEKENILPKELLPKVVTENNIDGAVTERPLMNEGDDDQAAAQDILLKNKECDVSEEILEEEIQTEEQKKPLIGDHVFNPVLYTRGLETDAFYLILSGKVQVCSGNEGFMIT